MQNARGRIECEYNSSTVMKYCLLFFLLAPTGRPQIVAVSVERDSVTVVWQREMCTERNGVISHYVLAIGTGCDGFDPINVYPELTSGANVTYTLNPQAHVNTIKEAAFQVAAANDKGRGPFVSVKVTEINEGWSVVLPKVPTCGVFLNQPTIPGFRWINSTSTCVL